jgi:phospholipid N-methyltransferase
MSPPPASPRRASEPDRLLFLSKFLRHGTSVGAVTPTSAWFARKLLRDLDLTRPQCVVELGAGTGPITAELLRRAGPQCRCVIVELDADFCARLRQRFPAAEIVQADARDLALMLDERQIAAVDHVLCGLALPWFSRPDRHLILDTVRRRLTADGSFRQLSYMPWLHTREYRRYFDDVRFRLVLCNLPPGGFYVCRKPRSEVPPVTPT